VIQQKVECNPRRRLCRPIRVVWARSSRTAVSRSCQLDSRNALALTLLTPV